MRMLMVMAHPDDESMGNGGMIYRHTGAGVEVHLICATRGGAGWIGRPAGRRPEELPQIRGEELQRAAAVLGIGSLDLWEYPDGDVTACSRDEIGERIVAALDRHRPDVVVGWGPDGGYGHPDHIAIGAFTDAALAGLPAALKPKAHYHMAIDRSTEAGYRRVLDEGGQDGGGLPVIGFDEISVTFVASDHELAAKAAAIDCHLSQIEPWRERMDALPELRRSVLGHDSYRRVDGPYPGVLLEAGLFPELEAVRNRA